MQKKWTLTSEGRKEVKLFNADPLRAIHQKKYAHAAHETPKIVAFDIPERHRRKRQWLRKVLTSLGFTMLQKSLWIGKTKLPRDFIHDLHKLDLLSYVEIFAVTRTGSIKHLT